MQVPGLGDNASDACESPCAACLGVPHQGVEGVVFDMDGVLVDTEPEWERIFRGVLGKYGLKLSDEDRDELYGCSDAHENEVLGRNLGKSPAQARRIKCAYAAEHPVRYGLVRIEGASELVRRLHRLGLKVALASSSFGSDVTRMLGETDIGEAFDAVVSGDQVRAAKPDPAVYLRAAELLGVLPGRLVAVDDSHYGVEAALAAGMRVIQFTRSGRKPYSDRITAVCASHEEVLRTVRKLCGLD